MAVGETSDHAIRASWLSLDLHFCLKLFGACSITTSRKTKKKGSLGIHVTMTKIATNCTNCHEKGEKFVIIRANSRKFVAKLTLKIVTL